MEMELSTEIESPIASLGTMVTRFEADKARHARMVALVEVMLELNKKKRSGTLAPSEQEGLECEIAGTDREIDELVCELYALTDEEIRIAESKT